MLFLVTIFVINMPYFHLVVNFNVKTGRKGVINSQSFWRVTAYSILFVASKKWGTTNGIVPVNDILCISCGCFLRLFGVMKKVEFGWPGRRSFLLA